MLITDIDVVLHERRSTLAVFGVRDGKLPMGVLRISTDDGLVGHSFLSFPGPGPAAIADQIVTFVKPLLLGQDPLDIGRHWRRIGGLGHFISPITHGVVDVALWDIAGQAAGLPIHRLLGGCRDRVPVYFSAGHHASPEAYAEEARYWRERGWSGYKLHPPRAPWLDTPAPPIAVDIDACSAVREAVGPEMALMLDATWSYSYTEALRVGRAIEELDYYWYEDPLRANDIHGYRRLKQHLHIPMLATEITPGGLDALAQWVTTGATDFLRGDVVIKGGITGLLKIAHLAEAFNMTCEIHDGYNALGNVANLHVMMAIDNCEWFEVLAFNRSGDHSLEHLSYGLTAPLEIDAGGWLHAPTAPGLGVEVDWDLINSAVERVVS
jgi:L-alanine-DL-glutamate epimerase-like enolase superfamily enzyme